MNKPELIRISYTLLSTFERNPDEAFLYYIGAKEKPSLKMLEGKMFDEEVKNYVLKNFRLPDELGGIRLAMRFHVQYTLKFIDEKEGFVFVFVPDIYDVRYLYEIKTGRTSVFSYANTMQVPCYLYGFEVLNKPKIKAFIIHKDDGIVIMHNTAVIRKRARDWIYDNFLSFKRRFSDVL